MRSRDGEATTLHALIVTLVHSRHQYVHVCHTQTLADLIEGLEDAWDFFGGVPARVVLDNLKAAVTKADRYDPVFQRTFAEYARTVASSSTPPSLAIPRASRTSSARCSTSARASFAARPGSTATTCSARRSAGASRSPASASTAPPAPLLVFENEEKAKLPRSARAPRFDPPVGQCKVHPDHHVQFHKALYSVPTRHVGKRVWVRGDSKLVRIYVEGELVKTHERMDAGERSTDYDDYPTELAPYAMRDPEAIGEGEATGGRHRPLRRAAPRRPLPLGEAAPGAEAPAAL